MLPLDYRSTTSASPVFAYPYARSRETLDRLQRSAPLHACHGAKIRFVNPATGGYAMPTIAGFLQLLPAGFSGRRIALPTARQQALGLWREEAPVSAASS